MDRKLDERFPMSDTINETRFDDDLNDESLDRTETARFSGVLCVRACMIFTAS
jgi:hypothetical protein